MVTLSLMDNTNRLFIHRDMKPVTLLNSVEIILTPQFYTFIRENLDIRFAYQAKQIAASLFDDYLDNSKEYQYHVYKCYNDWCFFAYDIKEIEDFLRSIGIEKHRVSKIYFAQQLNEQLKKPIKLSEKNALLSIDDTVTLVPTKLIESNTEYNHLDLKEQKFNSAVSMGASLDSFISLKETMVLGSLFFILGSIFVIEGNRIKSSILTNEEIRTELFNKYPKYSSSSIRESLLSTYQPIDKKERAKRESLKEISKLLSAKSHLTQLTIDKNGIVANIKTTNANIANQVTRNSKAKNFKSSKNGLEVKVEKKI